MIDVARQRSASYLLPDPGGEVVRTLLVEVERLQEVERVARLYVDIRSNHPQVAGEVWRDLVRVTEEVADDSVE